MSHNPSDVGAKDDPRLETDSVSTPATSSYTASATDEDGKTPPTDTPLPPDLVNHPRYCVLELLGSGGMGTVYKARHRLMDRLVALKILKPQLVNRPAAMKRFCREMQAAARLVHPNIVHAYDAEQVGATHFLVLEYVPGVNLAELLREGGRLPVERACDYGRQAALGLQHAFENGMVHRDIKPHNLMLTPEGRVKILDFGLARFVSEAAPAADTRRLTGCSKGLGTPNYMAPEKAHHADIRADIYSLGCTLYHLLSGRVPFPGGTAKDKLRCHRRRRPDSLYGLRPEVPAKLAQVVARMMVKEPAGRYATPAEVAQALAPFACWTC